jgi:hypothetical protein
VLDIELVVDAGLVEVSFVGRPLAVYQFKAGPFKPYLRSLRSLSGVEVLLDAPPDHLHHHGLMYGVVVNGVNFWEEMPGSGYELPGPEISRRVTRDRDGNPIAELAHQVFWVPTKEATDPAAAAWMIEERTLAISVNSPAREVSVEWRSTFSVGPAVEEARLTGTAYHGFGLRLARAFDRTAVRHNGAGAAYTPEAAWDITPAAWSSATQSLDGNPITVSMFDDPANAREPRFFSMLNPFAYISATQGLDGAPVVIRRGEKFSLGYLVTVHARGLTEEAAAKRYDTWLQAIR